MVQHTYTVGSEAYNAPELWTTSSQQYDGVKADIFAAGIVLFFLVTKMWPFRRSTLTDPYYKRLAHKDKRFFWKIYEAFPCSKELRDLFEKMTAHLPQDRCSLQEALQHSYLC